MTVTLLCCFTLPQNQVGHIFCDPVDDGKDIDDDFPSLFHPLEHQSKNEGAHNQAQCVGPFHVVFQIFYFGVDLKQR